MTNPNPISKYAPNNSAEGRTEFTDKGSLENVPLVITGARTAKGANGVFWICEAARQDTGEAVVFTGSTVIDQTMAAVKESNGFPVAAMLVKVQPDKPGANWYWVLEDPPASASNAAGNVDRVAEVQAKIQEWGLYADDVTTAVKEVTGEAKKIRDLDDDQYAAVLEVLHSRAVPQEPPF